MDDHELMEIRAGVFYSYDSRGRMTGSGPPGREPGPRLWLGITMGGYVVRFGATVPDELAHRLAAIVEREPPGSDCLVPPGVRDEIRAALAQHAPITKEGGGPVYRFPDSIPTLDGAVELTDANLEVTRESLPFLYAELAAWRPAFAVVVGGVAVSACFSSRNGQRAAEAGVETLPDFRRRGYAAAATAIWGVAVREAGRIPLYSTAWTNLASQGVARRVGCLRYGSAAYWE